MKIDLVLTSCNDNTYYLKNFPLIHSVWKKRFQLDCYLILIHNIIPDYLEEYKDYIILFEPIENINTTYTAQCIRVLYPALFENKNILITDMDIIPISKGYFLDSIDTYTNDTFIVYTKRYINKKMLAICYNLGNSKVWRDIFKVTNNEDIIELLKKWYNVKYSGEKNSEGWFTDQEKLYEYVFEYTSTNNNYSIVFLNDKDIGYNRIDKKTRDVTTIISHENVYNFLMSFSDLHLSRRYYNNAKYRNIINTFIDLLNA